MKTKNPGHVPTFHVSVTEEGDKRTRTLCVTYRKRTKIATKLRDARSEQQRAPLRLAIHFGIETYFDTLPSDDGEVRLSWLEYRDEMGGWKACDPEIDIGDQISLMRRGWALLEKLGSVIERYLDHPNRPISDDTFANPEAVVDALRKSRTFIEIERFELDRRGYWIGTAEEWDREQDGRTEVA